MKNKKKYIRILLLMIASEIMLIVFVVHWLLTQYRSEKEILQKDLTSFYLASQDEVIDTLLFHTYVDPVFSGKKIITTLPDTTLSGREEKEGSPEWKTNGKITVSISHDIDSSAGIPDTIKIRKLADDLMLRSVRMIVSHSKDTMVMNGLPAGRLLINPDTALFIKHFHGRMTDAGMNFNIEWVMNREKAGKASPKQILLINPVTPFTLPGATVEQYNGYLFGSITPQIIFGFVLVFITGLAFGLAFRSIRQNIILNNLRDEFISNITHELKTPVATLSVALESLGKYRMSTDPAVMDEYLKLASQETRRLGELIDRVLNHSVLEENNSMLTVTRVNINVLIAEITSIMNRRLDNSGSVEFLPGEENIVIDGDPLFLKGVIISLIDNSIKYCDRKPEIKIFTGREKGFAVIRVNDNGPGIPDGYRKKIFEKFFRVPSDNVHNVKGYGLGLSFAALVMDLHKGSIQTENLDPGCSFILKLPSV